MKKYVTVLNLFLVFSSTLPLWAGTATIDATVTNQYIRGFGACSAWHESAYSTQLATWYWDSTGMTGNNPNGIGMSMLRCHIPYTNTTTSISDPGETAVMKQAIALGVTQVWCTEWAPPNNDRVSGSSWGSSNNNFLGAASGAPNGNDTDYASYLVNYIKYANTQISSTGVQIMAVSPQNEPDWNPTYESNEWTAGQFDVFVGALHSALQTAGLSTKIMIPESFADNKALATTAMDDATNAPYVSVIGNHLYGLNGATPYSLAGAGFSHLTNQESWETEMSDVSGAANDTTMKSGLQVAGWLHQCIVDASMNAYHAWWLYPASGSTNESLIGSDNASTKKLWCLGNWSRFVRPGYYRIGATEVPSTGVSVSAFENASSNPTTVVVVAMNVNTSTVSQPITFNGITVTSVTPWVTDPSNNLTRLTAIPVNGNTFTYTLTAQSITTFVGNIGAVGPTATITDTLPPTATFTRTPTPIPGAFCMIDDFEDGNTVNNWGGSWVTYGDANTTINLTIPTGGAPGSTAHSLSASGSVSNYGGISCPLGGTVDLSPYSGGIVFYAKGSGTYWFQMAIPAVTDGDNFGVSFTASAAWTPVTVLFSQLTQRGFGTPETFSASQVSMFQWASVAGGTYNLQLDNVEVLGAYCPGGTPTYTPTPSRTPSSTATYTLTATVTSTATRTVTSTLTPTSTNTTANTATPTVTSTTTPTRTSTPANTATSTSTPVNSPTSSFTPANSFTFTNTPVNTTTFTSTSTPTKTNTPIASFTATFTGTSTATKTNTPANSPTFTSTVTSTVTPVFSATASLTPTFTSTSTKTNTSTSVFTSTPTPTATATWTSTASRTATPSSTYTPANTTTSTFTDTPTNTFQFSPTVTLSPTVTNTPTESFTPTITKTLTPTNSFTLSSTITNTPTSTFTRTNSPTPTPTNIFTPSSTPTYTTTTTFTRTNTPTFTSTPTNTFQFTPTITHTPTLSWTPTDTFTSTVTSTPTLTSTTTFTLTPTHTWTPTSTPTASSTSTPSFTATSTGTSSSTPTKSFTPTNTFTATSSFTPTNTWTHTFTPTWTFTPTSTTTQAPTPLPGHVGIYPNPAPGETVNILPPYYQGFSNVRIEVFTLGFRKVIDFTEDSVPSGTAITLRLVGRWGNPLANGLYYVVVTTDSARAIGKLLLLK